MPRKLLIVDDQPGLLRIMQRHAEDSGWSVRAVQQPLSAIDAFLEFAPDVVVLDMVMPEKDGLDLLGEMLLASAQPEIVLTSGFGPGFLRLGEALARFHGAPRVAVLKKPFRSCEFLASIGQSTRADAAGAAG